MTAIDTDVDRFPGDSGMWVFVIIESLVFTSYFCIYLYARTQHETAFLHEQTALTMWLGVVQTIVLLSSSWAIAICVQHARAARFGAAQRAAIATVGLGAVFFSLKIIEWVHLVRNGHTFTSSEFMQHFFFLTGIHAIHLIIGFVALGLLVRQLASAERRSVRTIETCSTYWHTVDLFWVVIFALLYVVR